MNLNFPNALEAMQKYEKEEKICGWLKINWDIAFFFEFFNKKFNHVKEPYFSLALNLTKTLKYHIIKLDDLDREFESINVSKVMEPPNFQLMEELSEKAFEYHINLLSLMHATKSFNDIIIYIINETLTAQPINKPSIFNLIKNTPHSLKDENKALKNMLKNLTHEHSFEYINAFINLAKHKQFPLGGLQGELSANKHGCKYGHLIYRNPHNNEYTYYTAIWGSEIKELTLDLLKKYLNIAELYIEEIKRTAQ